MEKRIRSLIKSVSFRIIATFATMLLVFLFTRNLVISAGIGALDFLVKIVIYYLHERMWNTLDFGREKSRANLLTQIVSPACPKNSPLTLNTDEQERKQKSN